MSEQEEWLDVLGYEDLYQVSSLGRVRSKGMIDSIGRKHPPRLRKSSGLKYLQVQLSSPEGKRRFSIHRLVLEAFVGPCPLGLMGLHDNDDPKDNRLENLRWGTHSENFADSVRNGKRVVGTESFLSPDQVKEIRKRCTAGEPQHSLAKEFAVDPSSISNIHRRVTWSHV